MTCLLLSAQQDERMCLATRYLPRSNRVEALRVDPVAFSLHVANFPPAKKLPSFRSVNHRKTPIFRAHFSAGIERTCSILRFQIPGRGEIW